MVFTYPDFYTDEDKALYDDLICRGKLLIGSKIPAQDEFLLDLSAKITINKFKGYESGDTPEEIEERMKIHRSYMDVKVVETPDNLPRPFQKSLEETYEEINKKPDDFDENFLVKKVDEMLDADCVN
jgi:hypothetical protein